MSVKIIAEFGVNHFGDIKVAKELIRVAKECGADLAKGQAYLGKDMHNKGSMQNSFYDRVQFSFEEYVELLWYGTHVGIDVFFSVFSRELEGIAYLQKWHKLSGSQIRGNLYDLERDDRENMFFSVPAGAKFPNFKLAQPMYVNDYMSVSSDLTPITLLEKFFNRPVGLSDHSLGTDLCIRAVRGFGANVIEKHFTLEKNVAFRKRTFRDTIHSLAPKEFEFLCSKIKGSLL